MPDPLDDPIARLWLAHRHGGKSKAHPALFREAAEALTRERDARKAVALTLLPDEPGGGVSAASTSRARQIAAAPHQSRTERRPPWRASFIAAQARCGCDAIVRR